MEIVDGVPGWCSCPAFFKFAVARAPAIATFAEVGVLFGSGSQAIAKAIETSGKDIQLWMIDAFDEKHLGRRAKEYMSLYRRQVIGKRGQSNFRTTFDFFREGRAHGSDKHHVVQASSPEVANVFANQSLDMVFLDNTHDTEHVIAEIAAWTPKVKPGGLLAGKRAGVIAGAFIKHEDIYAALNQVYGGEFETTGETDWYVEIKGS